MPARSIPALQGGTVAIRGVPYCNSAHAAERFGFTSSHLTGWRSRCPMLGRALTAIQPRVVVEHPHAPLERTVWLYPVAELQRITTIAQQAASASDWPTGPEAAQRLHATPKTINRWAFDACPALPGRRRLRSRKEPRPTPTGVKPVRVYDPRDIESIEDALRPSSEFLSAPQVQRELACGRLTLSRYATRGCPALGGNRLYREKRPALLMNHRGGVHRVWHYRRSDIEAIAQWQSIADEGLESQSQVLRRTRCCYQDLWKWSTKGCPHLKGQRLYRVKRPTRWSNGHLGNMWHYRTSEIDSIVRGGSPAAPPDDAALDRPSTIDAAELAILLAIYKFNPVVPMRGPTKDQLAVAARGDRWAEADGKFMARVSSLKSRGFIKSGGKGRGSTGYELTAAGNEICLQNR